MGSRLANILAAVLCIRSDKIPTFEVYFTTLLQDNEHFVPEESQLQHIQLPPPKKDQREYFYYIIFLLMLSTSQYHLFEQQYPQNINSVQENMSYGTSENSYKK